MSPEEVIDMEKLCETAKREVEEQIANLQDQRRICGLKWSTVDSCIGGLFVMHSWMLSTYGLGFNELIALVSQILCLVYGADILLRIYSFGGLKGFVSDSLFPYSSWANSCQLLLTILGVTCTVVDLAQPDVNQVRQALMAINLWRVFFVVESFVALLFSFWHGVRPISVYIQLLFVACYCFSFVAWLIFDGDLTDDYANFNSMGDAMLLMLQVRALPHSFSTDQ